MIKSYIQIGSNIGKDFFQNLIERLPEKSKIILIEPDENCMLQLKNNYKTLANKHEIYFLQIAIVPYENLDMATLYYYANSSRHNSLLDRKTHKAISKKQIHCSSLLKTIKALNIDEVELLSIDIEGLDYEILLTLDFSKVKIKKIICEIWPYNNDDKNNNFKSGPNLLLKLKNKLKSSYTITETRIDNMPSLEFTKI